MHHFFLHKKNGFANVFKNLIRYRSENNIVEPQNNYIRNSNMMSKL